MLISMTTLPWPPSSPDQPCGPLGSCPSPTAWPSDPHLGDQAPTPGFEPLDLGW